MPLTSPFPSLPFFPPFIATNISCTTSSNSNNNNNNNNNNPSRSSADVMADRNFDMDLDAHPGIAVGLTSSLLLVGFVWGRYGTIWGGVHGGPFFGVKSPEAKTAFCRGFWEAEHRKPSPTVVVVTMESSVEGLHGESLASTPAFPSAGPLPTMATPPSFGPVSSFLLVFALAAFSMVLSCFLGMWKLLSGAETASTTECLKCADLTHQLELSVDAFDRLWKVSTKEGEFKSSELSKTSNDWGVAPSDRPANTAAPTHPPTSPASPIPTTSPSPPSDLPTSPAGLLPSPRLDSTPGSLEETATPVESSSIAPITTPSDTAISPPSPTPPTSPPQPSDPPTSPASPIPSSSVPFPLGASHDVIQAWAAREERRRAAEKVARQKEEEEMAALRARHKNRPPALIFAKYPRPAPADTTDALKEPATPAASSVGQEAPASPANYQTPPVPIWPEHLGTTFDDWDAEFALPAPSLAGDLVPAPEDLPLPSSRPSTRPPSPSPSSSYSDADTPTTTTVDKGKGRADDGPDDSPEPSSGMGVAGASSDPASSDAADQPDAGPSEAPRLNHRQRNDRNPARKAVRRARYRDKVKQEAQDRGLTIRQVMEERPQW